jgi:hypothetical protein
MTQLYHLKNLIKKTTEDRAQSDGKIMKVDSLHAYGKQYTYDSSSHSYSTVK